MGQDRVSVLEAPSPIASPASTRGERLYPRPAHRLYWHLTCLRQQYEHVASNYVKGKGCSRLVDYGCGNMPYRPLFEPHIQTYVGCDFPGNELADCHLEPDREIQLPFDSESVDVVLSSQVLEHVVDPQAYLAESSRVLAGDGLLILSTHGTWRYHPDPTDYWRWTCDGLRLIIAQSGFDILYFNGVMGPEATALQLWQDEVYPRVPRGLRYWFRRYMQLRMRRADRRCAEESRRRDAAVYILVAQKRKHTY